MPMFPDRPTAASARPIVMGILNVTPDSFSDGGEYPTVEAAVARGLEMVEQGARIVDVGAESTRPGSVGVADDEQIRRAVPVIRGMRAAGMAAAVSIDTRSAQVAAAAIEAGVTMVNDVSALRDDTRMARVVADAGVELVLMHRRGASADMQRNGGPVYQNVVDEIKQFLRERVEFAVSAGIAVERIIVDPGIGFGKRTEDNLAILRGVAAFTELGRPVLIGASRKRFLGELLGLNDPEARDAASIACALIAALQGAAIVRVHDVRGTCEALRLAAAVQAVTGTGSAVGL
jgi:dihydropteroate synthase